MIGVFKNLFKPKPTLLEQLMEYPIFLLAIGTFFLVFILKVFEGKSQRQLTDVDEDVVSYPLPKINLDMTQAELELYDGKRYDGRTLVAINGSIYDITGNGPTRAAVRLSGKSLFYPSGIEGWKMAKKLEEKYYVVGKLKDYSKIKTAQSELDTQALENLLECEIESPRKRFKSVGGYGKPCEVIYKRDDKQRH